MPNARKRKRVLNVNTGDELIVSGVVFPVDGLVLQFDRQTAVSVSPDHMLYLQRRKRRPSDSKCEG